MNITHKCQNIYVKHKHIKLKLVKNVKLLCNTVYDKLLILWIFNILYEIWFPHIDLKPFC